MTDRSEMEALAERVEALATDFTSVDESDKRDAIAQDLRELARRLQPARVPERWRNVMQDLLRQFEKVGYDGDPTDPGYIAAKNARDMLATPAPESREADASTAFEGWSAAINAATELETNAPDERYRVRANAVRRWIEKRKPEAGQREGEFGQQFIDGMGWVIPIRNAIKYATYIAKGAADVAGLSPDAGQREGITDALMWLRGALDCPSFAWDADQREAAEAALASAQQAVKQERTGSRGEGGDAS